MKSLNERSWESLQIALTSSRQYGVKITRLDCGTMVVDAGVEAAGGMEAGLLIAEIGMAGLGVAHIEMADLCGNPWPWVVVRSDSPLQACYLSQAAHWQVKIAGFRAMGSGPACLLNQDLEVGKIFRESYDRAVLVLETRKLPDNAICIAIAETCGVRPENLALLVAPTSSLAGSVQIAARSVETGLHKLHTLGFDLNTVVSGMGRCPVALPTGEDLLSLGRTNDLVMFGCQVWLGIHGISDACLEDLVPRIPASNSIGYGLPFLETLKKAGGFYDLDPGLFAPAEVTLSSLDSGKTFHAGSIDQDKLEKVLHG